MDVKAALLALLTFIAIIAIFAIVSFQLAYPGSGPTGWLLVAAIIFVWAIVCGVIFRVRNER